MKVCLQSIEQFQRKWFLKKSSQTTEKWMHSDVVSSQGLKARWTKDGKQITETLHLEGKLDKLSTTELEKKTRSSKIQIMVWVSLPADTLIRWCTDFRLLKRLVKLLYTPLIHCLHYSNFCLFDILFSVLVNAAYTRLNITVCPGQIKVRIGQVEPTF